jgi:hypothetical protein
MRCQRCTSLEPARYRVFTDELDMIVCPRCAAEARDLGIGVEPWPDPPAKSLVFLLLVCVLFLIGWRSLLARGAC